MVGLIAAILVPGLILPTAETNPAPAALHVRVYADKQVDRGIIRPALEVAADLLASAGIVVSWRVCEAAHECTAKDGPTIVIFSSKPRRNDSENCGLAAHGTPDSPGTVIVSSRASPRSPSD